MQFREGLCAIVLEILLYFDYKCMVCLKNTLYIYFRVLCIYIFTTFYVYAIQLFSFDKCLFTF